MDSPAAQDVTIAVRLLRDLAEWRLEPDRWDTVSRSMDAIEGALARGDLGAFRESVAGLGLLGPGRITRLGTPPKEPPPRPVRERADRLVHDLNRATEPPRKAT
ncbi:hypothetical protein Val02_51980 [Virgisporangium aliadipatigenens]|uniref:CATRA-Associated Small Protein domain-containing protein n=1 Tax=Virgisporangium aliadipatigenens TaxID=741659 RepID=A0A8J4DTK2_9ACTN|nr:CATRA system-associated protein [Virgisporangium aliadipatigenens]GIJ48312.1 hypothetical protein Val02_51980 [Virgisporangium aliadipatigenens]